MATNNGLNTGVIASQAQAEAGTDQRLLITPATLKNITDLRVSSPYSLNLGMTLSGGTLTMTQANGSALSGGSPAKIFCPSNVTNGAIITHTISANVDVAESSLSGNLFNTRNLVAWGEDHPFYVYLAANATDASPMFFLAAQPHHVVTPVATSIGSPGSAIADLEYAFFAFDTVTAANYASRPCVCLGSLRAQKDASNNWTFQALSQNDGVGRYNEETWFNMPVGQFITGSYLINVTVPVFSSQSMQYRVDRNGVCHVKWDMSGDGGTDGSGTNQIQIFLPFNPDDSQGGALNRRGMSTSAFFAGTTRSNLVCDFPSGTQRVAFFRVDSTALLLCNAFTNGDRWLSGAIRYLVRSS